MSQFTVSIAKSLSTHSQRPAFTLKTLFAYHRYTHQDIKTLVQQSITWIRQQQLKSGDKLIISSYNCPQYVYTMIACLFEGIIVVPVDFQASDRLIQKIADDTKPKLIITSRLKPINQTHIPITHIENLNYLIKHLKKAPLKSSTKKDSIAQILYTSGTTGNPKGVILTHRNIHSNISAVTQMVNINHTYNTLSILPLSHIFEQIGMYSLLLVGAHTTYMQSRRASEIVGLLKHEHPNTILTVPAFLELFKDKILDKAANEGKTHLLNKLLRLSPHLPQPLKVKLFASIHRELGGQLQRFIVGGAALAPETEIFWTNLGVEILKGYGLTETSPILTATPQGIHKPGSAGLPLPGVKIKLDKSSQILAKGDNVFQGYYQNPTATRKSFTKDGWFKTGDIGHFDQAGYIYLRSRIKNIIVKANGKNIYPEDIEHYYNAHPDIKEAVVVGVPKKNDLIITAVLLPATSLSSESANAITASINQNLEDYQQIQNTVIWREPDFPRTLTLKVKRPLIIKALTQNSKTKSSQNIDKLIDILSTLSAARPEKIKPSTLLTKDLGFDSLKIIELAVKIEEVMQVKVPEHLLTPKTSVSDLREIIQTANQSQTNNRLTLKKSMFSKILAPAKIYWPKLVLPLVSKYFQQIDIIHPDRLADLPDQLIIVANHTSHLDTPVIVNLLPKSIRSRLSVAGRYDYFFEEKSFIQKCISFAFTHIGGGFPLVRDFNDQEHSVTESFSIAADIIDHGWSILIYPEGTRNSHDTLLPFKPGLGLIVQEFDLPILPIRLRGLNHILPKGASWPSGPHPVSISVGPLQRFKPSTEPTQISQKLQTLIENL